MPELTRTFAVAQGLHRTAEYVSDPCSSAEWDPHTRSCRRLDDGPLGVGSRFAVVRHLLGLDAELECEVIEYEPDQAVRLRCTNAMMRTDERMEFEAEDEHRTRITWTVQVKLLGSARHGAALVPTVLRTIADDGTVSLQARVEAL